MKENKSDIVRIHDDGTAGKVAAPETSGGTPQNGGNLQDGATQAESSANVKDPRSTAATGRST